MGQNSADFTLVRTIARGEKVADIVAEAKSLAFSSRNEVALVKLANGERALVVGEQLDELREPRAGEHQDTWQALGVTIDGPATQSVGLRGSITLSAHAVIPPFSVP